ncbi:MAG TPA: hypothetical protein DEB13_02675 [Candidatus Yanofskybacteria bacterium]|nr:hypothetical protein [Candidatus Yanofskybacteria bacterium]
MRRWYHKMEPESKRILLFSTAFRPMIGGSEIAMEEICRRLPEISFDLITARFSRANKKTEQVGNIKVHRLGLGFKFDKYLLPILGFFKARSLAGNGGLFAPATAGKDRHCYGVYSRLHAYQASYGAIAAYLVKIFDPNVSLITTLQEGKELDSQGALLKMMRGLVIKKSDKITAISNYLAEFARKLNKKATIIVIPNGVDSDLFKKLDFEGSEMKSRLNIREDERIVMTVSRLVPKNGVDVLIKAFARLDEVIGNLKTRLVIIGSGPMADELESLTVELGVSDRIIFAGDIYYEDLPGYLSMADVFARPSYSEGLGDAFLEAMAVGVPIIGTRVGGIVDFLEDGVTGLFCGVGDHEDLAKKIKMVLSDVDLRRRLIENGRELAKNKYSWQSISEKFQEIYNFIPN